MNTIGKILVILNFVFALVVGGFLVIDFATRTNWKTSYDNLKREMDVLKAGRDASGGALANVVNDNKAIALKLDELTKKAADEEAVAKANEAKSTAEIEDWKNRLKDTDQTLQKSLAETGRIKEELKDRELTIQKREKAIIELEGDRNKYRAEAIAQEGRSKALQDRNDALSDELQRLALELRRRESGGAATQTALQIRNPNEPNPPSVKVKGKIERVDEKEPGLVQISLGTDQGINRNNTLYAYRLRPEAKYLGMIRIVEAYHNRAVGRLMAPPGAPRLPLREGDEVSSDLSN